MAVIPRPASVARYRPSRADNLAAIMPAANTTKTTPANNRPSVIGEKPRLSTSTRGALEKMANRPTMRRLAVLAGTTNLISRIRAR
jgi:hypothetical protein